MAKAKKKLMKVMLSVVQLLKLNKMAFNLVKKSTSVVKNTQLKKRKSMKKPLTVTATIKKLKAVHATNAECLKHVVYVVLRKNKLKNMPMMPVMKKWLS